MAGVIFRALLASDNPKRVWSIDKIGKAIFYYQRELNERFMSVVT